MRNKNGFSLVELLAVIVVLAIIAIIGTLAYNAIVNGNRTRLDNATQNTIENAAVSYCLEFACVAEGATTSTDVVTIGHLVRADLLEDSLRHQVSGRYIRCNAFITINRSTGTSYDFSAEFNMDPDSAPGNFGDRESCRDDLDNE